jgi:diguanylate cyclase (GGDEF)-like protein
MQRHEPTLLKMLCVCRYALFSRRPSHTHITWMYSRAVRVIMLKSSSHRGFAHDTDSRSSLGESAPPPTMLAVSAEEAEQQLDSHPRLKPSGFYERTERTESQPPAAESVRVEPRSEPERELPSARRGSTPVVRNALVHALLGSGARRRAATVLPLVAAGLAWFADSELELGLIAVCPFLLIALGRDSARSYVAAGLTSLLLAALESMHPIGLMDAGSIQPHRLLDLLVLAFVLLRLRSIYGGVRDLSRRDPLTGLLNRRGFEELAAKELERAYRYERPVAFGLIDIDRFKKLNDQFGHVHGDRILQLLAAQLNDSRRSDLAVRLGGDEFGLLMPETDQAAAEQVVARLKQRVEALSWNLGISVGVTAGGVGEQSMQGLIAEADRRMYEAKQSARGR